MILLSILLSRSPCFLPLDLLSASIEFQTIFLRSSRLLSRSAIFINVSQQTFLRKFPSLLSFFLSANLHPQMFLRVFPLTLLCCIRRLPDFRGCCASCTTCFFNSLSSTRRATSRLEQRALCVEPYRTACGAAHPRKVMHQHRRLRTCVDSVVPLRCTPTESLIFTFCILPLLLTASARESLAARVPDACLPPSSSTDSFLLP